MMHPLLKLCLGWVDGLEGLEIIRSRKQLYLNHFTFASTTLSVL